jgi:putative (di)nucleoside polyphosphate hydrolase
MNKEPKTKKPYRLNASIIAQKNGKFLLVKKPRTQHAWQFPQGGVENNESLAEAAKREFAEELGTDQIKLLSESECGIYHYDWSSNAELNKDLQNFRGQEVHFFLAKFYGKDTDIQLDTNELVDWKWVDVSELEQLIESTNYLTKILKIIDA